jgi:hypothetical protein
MATKTAYDIVCETMHKRSASIYGGMKARAKKERALVPFTLAEFREWLDHKFTADGTARCEYSGEMVLAENFSVDHRHPITRNGSWALENLAICTQKQNLRKGIMTKGEYAIFAALVTDRLPYDVQQSIWRKLEVGDVQRFSHFKRLKANR